MTDTVLSANLSIGARIKSLRTRLGLTQTRFAEAMGVSFVTVSRWENNQSSPSPSTMATITRAEEEGIAVLAIPSQPPPKPETPKDPDFLDFLADPERVKTFVEGERLGYGHLFNPVFATETSLIDPLPHQ